MQVVESGALQAPSSDISGHTAVSAATTSSSVPPPQQQATSATFPVANYSRSKEGKVLFCISTIYLMKLLLLGCVGARGAL